MAQRSTFQIEKTDEAQLHELAAEAEASLPIEQTPAWYRFERTFPDRVPLGFFAFYRNAEPIALIALQRVEYHGTYFLWAKHGPVWLAPLTPDLESEVASALVDWARQNYPRAAFLRIHVDERQAGTHPPMQIVTYDQTVVMSTAGGSDGVMAGLKKRGRSYLRQYLRRTPVEVADETAEATQDFGSFHRLMTSTASRQNFNAWSADVYQSMLRELGPEHARLYSARLNGEMVAWAIFTVSGNQAVYYYAASSEAGREAGAPTQILYHAAIDLGDQGVEEIDLMGIGSDLAPSLMQLNSFKTGFAKEITEVAPARDLVISKTRYRLLTTLRSGSRALKEAKSRLRGKSNEKAK
ncbi:MAG: GNAT family N-acetyltransferase [Scrofimicrobium sp.]